MLEQQVRDAVLDFVQQKSGISRSDTRHWRDIKAVIDRLDVGRQTVFTTEAGDTYAIHAVTAELLIVRPVNSETHIDHSFTYELNELVKRYLSTTEPLVLICYDVRSSKLREQIERDVVPTLQAKLGKRAKVVTEYAGPLAIEPGMSSQAVAEQQAQVAAVVIMCLTTGYVNAQRFPHQMAMFGHMLRGKIIPILFESGLSIPAALSMLEADDGFEFDKLVAAITRMLP